MFGEKMTAMKKKDIHEESVLFKSPFLGLRQFLPIKNDEKCPLLHVKSSFRL